MLGTHVLVVRLNVLLLFLKSVSLPNTDWILMTPRFQVRKVEEITRVYDNLLCRITKMDDEEVRELLAELIVTHLGADTARAFSTIDPADQQL